ncbi:unnamed protein product, partial [Rotaria socialis]
RIHNLPYILLVLYIRGNPKIRFKIATFMIYALIVTTDATPLPEQTKFSKTHLNAQSGIATIIHSHS